MILLIEGENEKKVLQLLKELKPRCKRDGLEVFLQEEKKVNPVKKKQATKKK